MLPDGSALVESPTDPDHTFISGTTQGLILHRNNRWPNVALFGAAHFANAFSMGIQVVLMAWLAVGVLRLPAGEVGWVQASVFLPNVLLILYAGGFSDRKSAAAISMYANLAVALSHGIACTLYLLGYLNFQTLLLYALLLGAGNAFVQTAREKLVVQTGGGQIHRVISIAGVCQFGAQALGMAVVSFSDRWGVEWLLALQGGTCLVAAVLYGALARLSRATEPGQASTASLSLSAVLADAWASLPMRHTLILVGFNGAMHLGFFIVVLPLMARDIMGFTSFEYSFLQLTFVTGSVAAHAWMLYKAVQYPGQNILFCLLYSGVIGFALSAGPTVAGLYALIFLWGCVAGISANLSRLVVHSIVPGSVHGRSMALYQFVLIGMAPVGAVLAGYLVTHGSVWLALKVMAWASILLFGLFMLSRSLWGVKAVHADQEPGAQSLE